MSMILYINDETTCTRYIFKSIKLIIKIFNENVTKNVKRDLIRRIYLQIMRRETLNILMYLTND